MHDKGFNTSPASKAFFLELLANGRNFLICGKDIMSHFPVENANFRKSLQLPNGSPKETVWAMANLF